MKEEELELNKKRDIYKVVNQAIQNAHTHPSPETMVELQKLRSEQQNIMDKFEEFKEDNKEGHQMIIDAVNKLEEKLEVALKSKANYWVEKLIIWLGAIIGLGIIGYIGTLFIKLIEMK